MGNKLLVLNHKMNLVNKDLAMYLKYLETVNGANLVVCPSALYLPYFVKHGYSAGIQNLYIETKGSFTGEISAVQAVSLGVKYAIIGHSERRQLFHETNNLVSEKLAAAKEAGLTSILCIGEAKHSLRSKTIILNQLKKSLNNMHDINNIIIAYEPIWAIGTNKTPTNKQIEHVVSHIKAYILKKYNREVKVLYGGSVNEKNIKHLNQMSSIDGYLVGNASLNVQKVDEILRVILQR